MRGNPGDGHGEIRDRHILLGTGPDDHVIYTAQTAARPSYRLPA